MLTTAPQVQLPNDGLLAFARHASHIGLERMKRYQFGCRYSDVTVTGGQPKATGEANFDIISPFRSMASEAELLGITDKIITEFRGLATYNFQLHVSHQLLLEVLLDCIPSHARNDVKAILAELGTSFSVHTVGKRSWRKFASASRRLTISSHVSSFVSVKEYPLMPSSLSSSPQIASIDDVKRTYRTVFPASTRRLQPAFDDLEKLLANAKLLGVSRPILIRPYMCRYAEVCARHLSRTYLTDASLNSSFSVA
jgi:hypothetical protein